MRSIIQNVSTSASALLEDFRNWAKSHFDMFFKPETGALNSVYLRMPWTRAELFVERSNVNVGFGYERDSGNLEFFLWRVRGTISVGTSALAQEG